MFGIHCLLQRLKRRKHIVVLPLSEGARVGVTVKRKGGGEGAFADGKGCWGQPDWSSWRVRSPFHNTALGNTDKAFMAGNLWCTFWAVATLRESSHAHASIRAACFPVSHWATNASFKMTFYLSGCVSWLIQGLPVQLGWSNQSDVRAPQLQRVRPRLFAGVCPTEIKKYQKKISLC